MTDSSKLEAANQAGDWSAMHGVRTLVDDEVPYSFPWHSFDGGAGDVAGMVRFSVSRPTSSTNFQLNCCCCVREYSGRLKSLSHQHPSSSFACDPLRRKKNNVNIFPTEQFKNRFENNLP